MTVSGNTLYEQVLAQVVRDAFDILPCRDVNVFLDNSGFIKPDRFRDIVAEEAGKRGVNPIKIHKVSSEQNKCVQIVDFVVGAARSKHEHRDVTFDILIEKVSVARRR